MADIQKLDNIMENSLILVNEDNEDPSLSADIRFPVYANLNEQKVLKSVQDVFKGFSHDATGAGQQFKDTAALAQYTDNTMADIKNIRRAAEASQRCHDAAAMARFWYLGETINNALTSGRYGTSAVNSLATQLKKSIPYIYQIRAVATKLTVVDCYLLGVRGLTSTHLRKLAQVKDDDIRKAIIDAFIEATPDTVDEQRNEQAVRRFVAAINEQQNASLTEAATSDPMNGGSDTEVSDEYSKVTKQIGMWLRMLSKLAQDEPAENLCNAMADFYLPASTPDAQEHLDALKEQAGKLEAAIKATQANFEDILKELASLKNAELDSASA